MQQPSSGVALSKNWDGVANDATVINISVANKNYNIRDLYVTFKVEYLWNGLVKIDGVDAHVV